MSTWDDKPNDYEHALTQLRLAEGERNALDKSHADLARRLADAGRENERLSDELELTISRDSALFDRLQAEQERLRAALETIMNYYDSESGHDNYQSHLARQALANEQSTIKE